MTAWTSDELSAIGSAEEVELSSLRGEGGLRKPVTIWVVRVGDDLYIRSVRGRASAWFRGVQDRHEGQIEADGIRRDVTFVDVSDDSRLHGQIDAAYRSKYHRYAASIVNSVLTSQARETTLQFTPSN